LPPSFTSLYRLLLRTTSAAVLNHKAATRYVRTLWKPLSAKLLRLSTDFRIPTLGTAEKAQLERWLCLVGIEQCVPKKFAHRVDPQTCLVDNTLSLLSTSAQSRGLAHKLTRNLAFLNFGFLRYHANHHYNATRPWDPHWQQQQYKPAREARPSQIKAEKFDSQCWGALEETARMAEGKSRLSLGRIVFHSAKGLVLVVCGHSLNAFQIWHLSALLEDRNQSKLLLFSVPFTTTACSLFGVPLASPPQMLGLSRRDMSFCGLELLYIFCCSLPRFIFENDPDSLFASAPRCNLLCLWLPQIPFLSHLP
jgi:hypothetical protein